MEKIENPRLEMLGLLTIEENNLVLYDALAAKDFAKFTYLIDKGYAVSAFILNCMLDFGFEEKISETLKRAQRHDNNIYKFMVSYWGQEKAEAFFAGNDFKNLIAEKFSDKALKKYQCWNAALIKGKYKLLLDNGQLPLIKDNLASCNINNLVEALIATKEFCYITEIGWAWKLRDSYSGRKYLKETKNWKELLCIDEYDLMSLYRCKTIEEVYDNMLAEGAVSYIYEWGGQARQYLLECAIISPFVEAEDWASLYSAGYYKAIDLNKWWKHSFSDDVKIKVIESAVRTRNWDFLEQKKCLWALFKRFRWCRCYRLWKS